MKDEVQLFPPRICNVETPFYLQVHVVCDSQFCILKLYRIYLVEFLTLLKAVSCI